MMPKAPTGAYLPGIPRLTCPAGKGRREGREGSWGEEGEGEGRGGWREGRRGAEDGFEARQESVQS